MRHLFFAHKRNNTLYLLIIVGTTFWCVADEPTPTDFESKIYQWSKTLAEAFHAVQKKYFQQVNPEKALTNAINSFVHTLDPHSNFMDPKAYKEILETTQGEFCGIGVIIDNMKEPEQEFLKIIETVPAGPADKAGLKADDKIVQINDEAVKGLPVEEIVAKLKGKRTTTVDVKVQRNTNRELLSFTITRDVVKEQNTLCYFFKEHNIYYLALTIFNEKSGKQLEELLKKCLSNKSKGLILDLRNNSGGLLQSVVEIAGLFLEKNSLVVTTKDREQQVTNTFATLRQPIAVGSIPIFILINNFTASAAEILAGCLQSYSNEYAKKTKGKEQQQLLVFLVGSTTFGKGSVQEVIPVSNDCAIKLTTALYYLPNNISIQGMGITPDFPIEQRFAPTADMAWFTTFFGHENTLRNSIKHEHAANGKKIPEKEQPKEKTWQERKQEQIGGDYIILSTMRLIEMLHMANKAYPEKVRTRADCINLLNTLYSTQDKITMEEIKC